MIFVPYTAWVDIISSLRNNRVMMLSIDKMYRGWGSIFADVWFGIAMVARR